MLIVVSIIAAVVLPSSLNLPQSSPSTTLEYAPVPPEDDSPPPLASGSFASLGNTLSNTLRTRVAPPPPPPDLPPPGQQKSCARGRQTEDPNSPPCQNFFDGDNFGETWQGVTANEITVLIYNQVGRIIDQGQGQVDDTPSAGTYCDVDILDCDDPGEEGYGEPDDDPHGWLLIANAFSRYFNERYQTYKRHVHFYYYWSGADTAPARKGDAADNWERLQPFAVLVQPWWGGFVQEYIAAMSYRDVSVFGAFLAEPRSFYQQYAPKVWSYWPDVENWAEMYSSYVCEKAGPGTVVNDGPFAGQQRVYGSLRTTDPQYENLQLFAKLAAQGMKKKCGLQIKTEKTFAQSGFWFDNQTRGENQTAAQTNMAGFAQDGVNTILYLGGSDTYHSEAAAAQVPQYFPEWIVAGDGDMDGRGFATRQNQDAWRYAWTHTYQLREDDREKNSGYQAYKEADPDGTNYNWAVTFYRDFFMLFQSIQVAGPRLDPFQVDAGLHAIQRRDSTSPYVAACYFHPGDYTCVKDGAETWWNPDKRDSNNNEGCFQMVRGGYRYAADRWSQALGAGIDVQGYKQNDDPCTSYGGTGVAFRPA